MKQLLKLLAISLFALPHFVGALNNEANTTTAELVITAAETDEEYQWYGQPIKYRSSYIPDVESVILQSMAERGWETKSKVPGTIVAWLNNKNGYDVIVKLDYNQSTINFQAISEERHTCPKKRKRCKIDRDELGKWRHFLRQSITAKIHRAAIADLLKDNEIRNEYLKDLIANDTAARIAKAREIIVQEVYSKEVLKVLADEVEKGYLTPKMKGQTVQAYAYFCKAIAMSKNEEYRPFLEKIMAGTSNNKLRNYIKGYFRYFDS